ncbi:MAG TPA: PAS domain S-box protein [Nitrospirae bacterium]|nr:sensory histidine kinase AtoS [bacterium BMS3Bbin09]HDO67497.1 PAS domain S-box protein [Nitrospirota bacterium]HDZ84030.1 PAS domain S-box protein [Nitrospirota bacterium]HEW81671.1 PAS domain S-box protein [Nitrospirota bacterium]
MDFITQWFQGNLDIVFFIYGLAFIVMGIVILVHPKGDSEFTIANTLWLLACFGLTHGSNELLDMWSIIKGRSDLLDVVRWFALITSYVFLFEFGRRLFRLSISSSSGWQTKLSGLLVWWLLPLLGIFILIPAAISNDFWKIGSINTRYFLGLIGGLLIGSGFSLYYSANRKILEPLNVRKYFLIGSMAFIIYGILGGLVVPKADFFPSNWLNTNSFFSTVKIPVQVFRAICAIAATWAVAGMLKIFNWEIRTKLEDAQKELKQQLRESERKFMEVVESSSDMIHSIDTDCIIIYSNKKGHELLGFSREEIIGKHFSDIYRLEGWEDTEVIMKKLIHEGSMIIDNAKAIRKNKHKIDIVLYLMAMYDYNGEFLGARLRVRDVSERANLENELKARVEELEEFYDMAIGRELKMAELKEIILDLKKED